MEGTLVVILFKILTHWSAWPSGQALTGLRVLQEPFVHMATPCFITAWGEDWAEEGRMRILVFQLLGIQGNRLCSRSKEAKKDTLFYQPSTSSYSSPSSYLDIVIETQALPL